MKCIFCNKIIKTWYCYSCNVEYMPGIDEYYYIYLIHNKKRYVCKKFIHLNETSFYIDEKINDDEWDINSNIILTLDNINITPSNFKDFIKNKLETLIIFQ